MAILACECSHIKAKHDFNLDTEPCTLCDCQGFILSGKNSYGPGHASKGDDPIKVLKPMIEQLDRSHKDLYDKVEDIQNDLAESDWILEPAVSPTGTLMLQFDDVTSEEVRTILSGALKNTNKLYTLNYMINNESENDNG